MKSFILDILQGSEYDTEQDSLFKRQPHKIVKHTQEICRLLPTNGLNVFQHISWLEG